MTKLVAPFILRRSFGVLALPLALIAIQTACSKDEGGPPPIVIEDDEAELPVISTHPQDQEVLEASKVSFAVEATGTDLSYQWKKNGLDIPGAVGNEYVIEKASLEDSGSNFIVRVSNSAGEVSSNPAFLKVTEVPTAPKIVTQPEDVTVSAPASASFTVEATGTDPMTYQWYRDGDPISGAKEATYSIATTTDADEGAKFFVMVKNAQGVEISQTAKLSVQALAPIIKTHPANVTAALGQTATFMVEATGSDPMTYQWMRNGVKIEGATESSHTTDTLTTSDDGANFSVLVSNSLGSALSQPAKLTVSDQSLPVIKTDPADIKVQSPNPATFTVVAEGPDLKYQWKRNGLDIAGATSESYTLATTSIADSGSNFMVLIQNAFGQVLSKPAVLTVDANPADEPVITTFMAAPDTIDLGGSTSLFWAVSNAESLEIDQGIGVVTGNSIAVTPQETTTYTLTATNGRGSVTATATVTVKGAAEGSPVITEFTASPTTIKWMGSSTLSWKVSDATSITIDQGVGDVTSKTSVSVSPWVTKEYTLTATNDKGSVTAKVKVTVQ